MKKLFFICVIALYLFAEEPSIPRLKTGIYLGLGASYNSVRVDKQLEGKEFSSIFLSDSLIALGETGGPANPYHNTQSTLAPLAQLGYLYRFSNSCWFLGCKMAYQYLGLTFTENELHSLNKGRYLAIDRSNAWTGHLLISSSQTTITHELFFLPLFGYNLTHTSVYLGAGPVVFGTQNSLYGITSLVQMNGAPSDIIGTPTNLSLSQWIWGGVAQLGLLYSFSPTWLLDFTYIYAVTGNNFEKDSALFSNSVIANGVYTQEGVTFVKIQQKISTQSFTITINKIF